MAIQQTAQADEFKRKLRDVLQRKGVRDLLLLKYVARSYPA
jgi:hypothetical protein